MREIELKIRVKDVKELVAKIERSGAKFGQVLSQKDYVFTRGDQVGATGSVFVRIREEKIDKISRNMFTLKKMVAGHGDKIECETAIAKPEEMLRAIREMDFVPYVTVVKTRREAKIGDVEICLDEVENLGSFVELEKVAKDDASHEDIVEELWRFAENFGLSRKDLVDKGYDVLLKDKEEK